MTARPILKISLCRPRRAKTLRFGRVPTSCSAVSLRTIGAIGTPRPGGNTFLFSRGRWKSGSAMAPRAVLDRVMWSSLTTLQARDTQHARWEEFRGSVPLCRWAPNAGPHHPPMRTPHSTSATVSLRDTARHLGNEPARRGWLPGTVTHPATAGRFTHEETAYARASTYDDPTEDPISTARIICLSGRDQSHWREDGGSAGL